MSSFTSVMRFLLVLVMSVAWVGCDPVQWAPMTEQQRVSDMQWMYGFFDAQYAFIDLKQSTLGFDFEQKKAEFLERARKPQSNQEFVQLMQEFVALVADAHTGLSFQAPGFRGVFEVASLGFLVERQGENLVISEHLPLSDSETLDNMGLSVGTVITHFNGMSAREALRKLVVPYRNLGKDDSNFTLLSSALVFRNGMKFPVPNLAKEPMVKLTIEGGTEVSVPWTKYDMVDFKIELEAASQQEEQEARAYFEKRFGQYKKFMPNGELQIRRRVVANISYTQNGKTVKFPIALKGTNGRLAARQVSGGASSFLDQFLGQSPQSANTSLRSLVESFAVGLDERFTTDSEEISRQALTPRERLEGGERALPGTYQEVLNTLVYPAAVLTKSTQLGETKAGYIRIDSFSPTISMGMFEMGAPTELVVADLMQTLQEFRTRGVENIILDTAGNPGGSLELVLAVAQVFSAKPIFPLNMQVRLNDNWVGGLKAQAEASQPPVKGYLTAIVQKMEADLAAGKKLSDPLPMDVIRPFWLQGNPMLSAEMGGPFRVGLLQDCRNASCGDIFGALLRANKLGVIMGETTMGAGGNVVSYDFRGAPATAGVLRQTESMVFQRDENGVETPIENNGVKPDIEYPMSELGDAGSATQINALWKKLFVAQMKELKDQILAAKEAAKAAKAAEGSKEAKTTAKTKVTKRDKKAVLPCPEFFGESA